jgi:hypothetical protein
VLGGGLAARWAHIVHVAGYSALSRYMLTTYNKSQPCHELQFSICLQVSTGTPNLPASPAVLLLTGMPKHLRASVKHGVWLHQVRQVTGRQGLTMNPQLQPCCEQALVCPWIRQICVPLVFVSRVLQLTLSDYWFDLH